MRLAGNIRQLQPLWRRRRRRNLDWFLENKTKQKHKPKTQVVRLRKQAEKNIEKTTDKCTEVLKTPTDSWSEPNKMIC